jgi:phosphatidylglycerol:prolipoprotein diacylglycerol transferase
MYPDLSYFFNDLFGTQVDNWTSIFKTFGFMLVMALLACGVFLKAELERLEKEGKILPQTKRVTISQQSGVTDILINALILAFIAAKIPLIIQDTNAFSADPAGILFSKQGNWLLGLLAGGLLAGYYLFKNSKLPAEKKTLDITFMPSEKTNDIIMIAGLTGVLGSKLFSVLENPGDLFSDPIGSLLSGAGLNVYGGLILAYFSVLWYVRKIGVKPWYMMDIGGMGILLGYAVGRMGCQFSGDGDWGIIAAQQPSWWFLPDWLWSYNYPNNVNNEGVLLSTCNGDVYQELLNQRMSMEARCVEACGIRYCHELNPKVYPTPIYETLMSSFAFGIMYLWRKKIKITGMLFFIYMVFNGIERFFIETIRVNEKYSFLGLEWTQAQYISVLFVLIGTVGIIYLLKNKENNSLTT